MKLTETKESLLNDFLSIKSSEPQKSKKLIERLKKYIKNKPDDDLTLILQSSLAHKADNDQRSFNDCCTVAAPIFGQLEKTPNWGYLELFVLSSVIGQNSDFDKTFEFFQKAIDILSDKALANDKKHKSIYYMLHFNMTYRMLRARYFEIDHKDNAKVAKLEKAFMQSYSAVIEMCVSRGLPHQYVLEVRRGVFENNNESVNDGLAKLEKLDEKHWYKTTDDEILEFLPYMSEELSTGQSNRLIGQRARERRNEIKLFASDIARLMDMDENVLTSIERGATGMSIVRLRTLARVLHTKMGILLGDEKPRHEKPDEFLLAMDTCMAGTTDEDKAHIVEISYSIMDNKYPERRNRKAK